jgi:hypothetical protein
MKYPIVSFQIVQADGNSYKPDVVALCADGSLWVQDLVKGFEGNISWRRLYEPEIALTKELASLRSALGDE